MEKAANVLITGGSGLVGSHLTDKLIALGYQVSHLSRSKSPGDKVTVYQWDIGEKYIEEGAIENADFIIHLAGAGVADKAWSTARKKVIRESRTLSTNLLYDKLQSTTHQVKAFLSASAIGYYGMDTGKTLIEEETQPGNDFLAEVTKAWEASLNQIEKLNIRLVKFRIGIVLSEKGGALPQIVAPIKYGMGAPLGSGKQYLSWIHMEDLCRMFIYALEEGKLHDTYNAVAPNPVTNRKFTRLAASVLKKPLFLPNVPGFMIYFLMGQRAKLVLGGNNVSSEKIEATGFRFKFKELKPALEDLLRS